MKKLVSMILVLAIVLSAGSCAALALESGSPEWTWDWYKTYTNGTGQLTLMTRDHIPGVRTYADGTQEAVSLQIFQDYDGFYFKMYTPDQRTYYNGSEAGDAPVRCSLIWYEGTANEFVEEFNEIWPANYQGIRLTASARGISGTGVMQNALSPRTDAAVLSVDADSIDFHCRFAIPSDTDYDAVFDAVCDYWYFPTYNNTVYTGGGANPDLILFLNEFVSKVSGAFIEAQNSGAQFTADEFRSMVNSGEDPELTLLVRQFDLIMEHSGGIRVADWEQIDAVNTWYTQLFTEQTIREGTAFAGDVIDAAGELSPYVHELFGDFVGDSYDDTMWIMDGVTGLLGELFS